MATALLNAIPGESPETRLAAFAERLGAVYEGSCWRMSPAVRETLRDAAVALALGPPELVDDAMDPGWEAVVLEAEGRKEAAFRDAEARERFAQAEAKATEMVSNAIAQGNVQAINYFVANNYVKALEALAKAPNQKVIMMPLEASTVIGSLAGLAEITSEAFGGRSGAAPPPPRPRSSGVPQV